MNIKHAESKGSHIASQTINGFSFKIFLNADTFTSGDTTYGSSKVDFSKCTVKAILSRNGKDHILFQDNLKILGLAATINTRGQLAFYSGVDHVTKLGDGKSLVSFVLPLGGPIKIADSDDVYLEVTALDGLFDASYLVSSYLEVKPVRCIGYETFIPNIKSVNVQPGTSSDTYSLGDNVIRTSLLNFDKTDFKVPVIQNLNFASDRLNVAFTFSDLILMKDQSLAAAPVNLSVDAASLYEADQSFVLTDFGQTFNQLVLDIQFDGAQVVASKNYIVVWSTKTDWTILDKAKNLQAKHINKDAAAIPASTN